ncbi:MAG: hypothetical protein ACKOQ6_07800 [Bacteroidota bacterium]
MMCIGICGHIHAQIKPEKLKRRLAEIENEVYQNPVAIKSELLGFLKQKSTIPDSTLGEIHLYLCISLGMTNQLDSGIWAAMESMRLLPAKSVRKASTLKTMAILYRLKGNWKEAEENNRLILQLNDSIWKNQYLKAITLQEYASLCLDRGDYFKATTLYLEALTAIQSADMSDPRTPYTEVKIRINLAEAYLKSKNYPFAIREFSSTLPRLDSLKDTDGFVRAGVNLAQAYILNNQLPQADSLLNRLMPKAERLQNEVLKAYINLYSGDAQASRKNFSKAIPYYRSAFSVLEKNNSWMLPECAIGLLNVLKVNGGETEAKQLLKSTVLKSTLESATPEIRYAFKRAALPFIRKDLSPGEWYDYTQKLLQLADSVTDERDKQATAQIQAEYQFTRQQEIENLLLRENEVLREKEQFKKRQLYFISSIAVLVLIILGMLFFRLRQRSMEKDRALQTKERELKFQHERSAWADKEKDLRELLIQQQKDELVRSVEEGAELRIRLEQLVSEQKEERRKYLLQEYEKSKEEKQSLGYLLTQFNALHPTFLSTLIRNYPNLSPADIQFCTLCRMNLSTKEISILFNIEFRSVYARKYRIVEKMGLTETDDFEKVLFDIE